MVDQLRATFKGDYRTMHSPLSSIIRREAVTVPPEMSVRDALRTMDTNRIGSVVVAQEPERIPLGVFTLQDLLRRIALQGSDLSQPIGNVMTRQPVSLKPYSTAYQAALLMANRNVRHLLVVDDDGRLAGIVTQNDLFALQRVGVKEISSEITAAQDIDSLVDSAREIRLLTDNMLSQGIGAEQLTHLISTLNDFLTTRIIELTLADFKLPDVSWCWIALGSEGRHEQTFSTDQDNGIIFACEPSEAEHIRHQFVPFGQAVNRRLDACGFSLCKGNIMAGNPTWCMSLDEWRRKFSGWIRVAEPEALLFASVFFDFRPLYGDDALSDSLREWLTDACDANPIFLRHMAANALRCRPPLGTIRDFVYDKSPDFPHTIDLKMYGSWPFVDSARIFALAHGLRHTNTAQRLRSVATQMNYSPNEAAAFIDSFYYVQLLRLRHQHAVRGPEGGANRIDPDTLNELERQILKEAFKQARKLQSRLRLDYQL
ncbi:MAG TPA: DUF294 nucleotidyltransferase-like domain-containing protein [Noviherbaspirillum sp.]